MLKDKVDRREAFLVLGIGCFLASLALAGSGQSSEFNGIPSFAGASGLSLVLSFALFAMVLLCRSRRVLVAFDAAGAIAAAVWLASVILAWLSEGSAAPLSLDLPSTVTRTLTTFLSLRWGMSLAVEEGREGAAFRIVFLSAAAGSLLLLAALAAGGFLGGIVNAACSLTSALALLKLDGSAGRRALLRDRGEDAENAPDAQPGSPEEDVDEPVRKKWRDDGLRFTFFGGRIVEGAVTGFMLGILYLLPQEPAAVDGGFAAIACTGILLCAGFAAAKTGIDSQTSAMLVPIGLFVLYALVVACFSQNELLVWLRVACGLLVVFQYGRSCMLAELFKPLLRLEGRTVFCFAVIALFASWSLASWITIALVSPHVSATGPLLEIVWYAVAAYVAYLALSTVRYVNLCLPSRKASLLLQCEQGLPAALEDAMAAIAQESGLSERESEVFEYLARGYSRTYIEKALYVSKNTVKSHMYRIYKKLDVNSQDALIDLVVARCWPPAAADGS